MIKFSDNPEFCSDTEYRGYARYMISTFYHKNQISNNDLVDAVVSSMMLADATYDQSLGTTRKTHRYNHGRYAIQVFCKRMSTNKRRCQTTRLYDSEHKQEILNKSNKDTPLLLAIKNEETTKLHQLLHESNLSPRQQDILQLRLDDHTFMEISKKYRVTKERVRQIYNDAIRKIRG